MGKWGVFFFSEEIAQLEAFKATLKNADEIAKVDEAIRVLQEKGE
jgi:hypothetical protein